MPARIGRLLPVVFLCALVPVYAGTPAPGFVETAYQSGIFNLDGFDWAPNGDLWIITKSGIIWVLRAGASQRTMIASLNVDSTGERGLVGLAVDPNFNTNHYLYFYYTVPGATPHNRVSRFTSVGDTLQAEMVLLEGPTLGSGEHNSGNLRFGLDGTLYIAMGDNRLPTMAQQRDNLLGKILRINTNGSIPSNNPFVGDPNSRPEIFAYGLRNPYRFSVQPVSGTLFIGNVGETAWEALYQGIAGANYGWPLVEGPEPPGVSGVTYPIFSYSHNGSGAAIIAGDHMIAGNFPPQYVGDYFYADFSLGKIYRLLLDSSNQVLGNEVFVSGVPFPVHVRVGPDAALYYASINFETIYRTAYVGGSNRQPIPVAAATPDNGLAPLGVQFDGTGSSDPDNDPLTYSWSFGDGGTSTSATPFHTYVSPGSYTATLTVNDTHVTGSAMLRIVAGNRRPAATILAPANGSFYNAGDTINYGGAGADPEDGPLSASAFSWTILFHHNTHVHPFLGPITGTTMGSFVPEVDTETDPNVAYEIILTVTDSGAPIGPTGTLSDTKSVTLLPNLSTMTFATAPRPDLSLTLDGTPFVPPRSVVGVVGVQRTISASSLQTPGDGHTYSFSTWSDGGAQTHVIYTPAASTTFTATFGCNLLAEATDLTVTPATAGQIRLTWSPPADPCLSNGQTVYRIYAAPSARPTVLPGSFPLDPAFAPIAATSAPSLTFIPDSGTQFYLVVGIDSNGSEGPVGAYGH